MGLEDKFGEPGPRSPTSIIACSSLAPSPTPPAFWSLAVMHGSLPPSQALLSVKYRSYGDERAVSATQRRLIQRRCGSVFPERYCLALHGDVHVGGSHWLLTGVWATRTW